MSSGQKGIGKGAVATKRGAVTPGIFSFLKNKKPRSTFTTDKDVVLLKSTLQHDPYRTGEGNWEEVVKEYKAQFPDVAPSFSVRTVRGRITTLVKLLKKQELVFKTGEEEIATERGRLIEEVISVMESLEEPINYEVGPDNEDPLDQNYILGDIFPEDEVLAQLAISNAKPKPKTETEKTIADKERDAVVSALQSDLAPSPKDADRGGKPPKPPKRPKLAFDDELVQMKHQHQLKIDTERLRLEDKKQQNEFQLESRRLEIEQARLELESKRDDRLMEDQKRRDDLINFQMESQKKMMDLMLQLTGKSQTN